MCPPSWSQPQRPLDWSDFLPLVPTSFCALSRKEAGDDLTSSHSPLSCFTKNISAIWHGTPTAPLSSPLKSIWTFYNLPSPWSFLWGRNIWTCHDSPWNYGVPPPPIKPHVIYLLTFSHSQFSLQTYFTFAPYTFISLSPKASLQPSFSILLAFTTPPQQKLPMLSVLPSIRHSSLLCDPAQTSLNDLKLEDKIHQRVKSFHWRQGKRWEREHGTRSTKTKIVRKCHK